MSKLYFCQMTICTSTRNIMFSACSLKWLFYLPVMFILFFNQSHCYNLIGIMLMKVMLLFFQHDGFYFKNNVILLLINLPHDFLPTRMFSMWLFGYYNIFTQISHVLVFILVSKRKVLFPMKSCCLIVWFS